MEPDVTRTYQKFETLWKVISALGRAAGKIQWDQQVMMPKQGGDMCAEELAALEEIHHERMVDNELWRILCDLRHAASEGFLDSMQSANVRLALRDADRARVIPVSLASDIARQACIGEQVWEEAKGRNDFAMFAPHLAKMIKLKRAYARYLAADLKDLYTPLLQDYEPDFTAAEVTKLLSDLREQLTPLVERVISMPQPDCSVLKKVYNADGLHRLSQRVISLMGFAGGEDSRLDVSAHPFCTGTLKDVRMTTRFVPEDGLEAFYSTLHEAGHGLYERNLPYDQAGMPVASAVSLGVHESQSRFWEVLVGKSRSFLRYIFPELQNTFPDMLANENSDSLYRAFNAAQLTPIRVNADPLTYNLHIIVRVDLEPLLISGDLEVLALPEAWNRRFKELFGFTPSDDAHGSLQDTHWSGGSFGYFGTYTLGNELSCQLYEACHAAYPDLENHIAAGDLMPARHWLREHIHRHGSLYDAKTLIKKATGKPLGCEALMRFFKKRYEDVYQTSL
ncbi:MAG: carboxypeptidase M32 [bacterium]|nr:carboxypeptidase M32 [bacterium]